MALYEIVGVCAYVKNGQVVRHRRPGAVVDLDEQTALRLGAAVKPKRRTPKPVPVPQDADADGGDT